MRPIWVGLAAFVISVAHAQDKPNVLGALRPGEALVVSPEGEVRLQTHVQSEPGPSHPIPKGLTIWRADNGALNVIDPVAPPAVTAVPPVVKPTVKRHSSAGRHRRHYRRTRRAEFPQQGVLTPPSDE
jgi:hypothetical protein